MASARERSAPRRDRRPLRARGARRRRRRARRRGRRAIADPDQFFRSYLLAFVFWNGLALGSLAVLMLQYLTGGAWGIAIRRVLEAATRTLPLMALALPADRSSACTASTSGRTPDAVAHDELLQKKALYLNVPFFLARAVALLRRLDR